MYIGVDPGKAGGVAGLAADGRVALLVPMPLVRSAFGRDEYDLTAIVRLLDGRDRLFVTVERSQPLPPQLGGSVANFQRGVAQGWAWMLAALRLPFELVSPRTWQRVMLDGTPGDDTKQRAVLAAQRLFPDADLTPGRRRRPHDGLADALLLAEYGRRRTLGRAE